MRLIITLPIVLLFPIIVFSQSAPLPSQFQSWNEIQLIVPLVRSKDAKGKSIDKVTATFNGILRIGRSNLNFLDNRMGATIDFRVNRYLSLFTAALYRKDEIVKNVRRYETRFNVGATFSKTWRNFSFRDRNMFEHRFRNGRIDLNLYRQRIQVSHPVKFNEKEFFSPFISEEGYYDLQSKTWIQNEFFAGITRRINQKASIDIAYIRSDSRPVNVNGISLNLKIRLR
ncbi:MAG: DUF2490 domain-containing protein [Acidobacteriota bacterium]|nr:DUF2490 domain-containing protein [Acidobacteriota bacterium]